MTEPATYTLDNGIATLRMDDGKVNCISPAMVEALGGALTRAESEADVVVITGRPGKFSAGFDLKVFQQGPEATMALVEQGARFALRLLQSPKPIVLASTGHAVAMGAFMMLCGDVRIGLQGPFTYAMNEVEIGMTLPHAFVALARARLTNGALFQLAGTARPLDPAGALAAGLLDHVADEANFEADIATHAQRLAALNAAAFAETKQRIHAPAIAAIDAAIHQEFASTNG